MFRAIQTNDESTGNQKKVFECRQFLIEKLKSVSSEYSKLSNSIAFQAHAAATMLLVRQNRMLMLLYCTYPYIAGSVHRITNT